MKVGLYEGIRLIIDGSTYQHRKLERMKVMENSCLTLLAAGFLCLEFCEQGNFVFSSLIRSIEKQAERSVEEAFPLLEGFLGPWGGVGTHISIQWRKFVSLLPLFHYFQMWIVEKSFTFPSFEGIHRATKHVLIIICWQNCDFDQSIRNQYSKAKFYQPTKLVHVGGCP